MPPTAEEKYAKYEAKIAALREEQKLIKRRSKEAQRKKNQRRNYVIGEMVTKYFPEVVRFEPGNKEHNAIEFQPLEDFLSLLAANQDIVKQLKCEAGKKIFPIRSDAVQQKKVHAKTETGQ